MVYAVGESKLANVGLMPCDDSPRLPRRGARRMTRVCRPTPVVRGVARKRLVGSRLTYRMAHQTCGTFVLLPKGVGWA
jgi:hypothetical protein